MRTISAFEKGYYILKLPARENCFQQTENNERDFQSGLIYHQKVTQS